MVNEEIEALTVLSEKLLSAPLLREVVTKQELLYVVPDARLSFVPFAALEFEDGTMLIEHCAIAYVPSIAVLEACRARRVLQPKRTCLAVGLGDDQGIAFAEQARAVAQLGWTNARWFSEVTVEEFLREAPDYDVLHLSCHGSVDDGVLDLLSASRLHFGNGCFLTARDVFDLRGHLRAELAFLNACVSGRFRLRTGSEVGGFWRAFLHGGAAALIATLAYVHPVYAQELAVEFYCAWLAGGVSKAEALRRAQLGMARRRIEPRHWATHLLVGDPR